MTLVRADTISCHAAYPIMPVFQTRNPAPMAWMVPSWLAILPRKPTTFGRASATNGAMSFLMMSAMVLPMLWTWLRKVTTPESAVRPKGAPLNSPLKRISATPWMPGIMVLLIQSNVVCAPLPTDVRKPVMAGFTLSTIPIAPWTRVA